jgi:hypothetical protein
MVSPKTRFGCVTARPWHGKRDAPFRRTRSTTKESLMLPDYIIYDELKRERERRERNERPRVEVPKQPLPEFDQPEDQEDESEEEDNRGVTIIEI